MAYRRQRFSSTGNWDMLIPNIIFSVVRFSGFLEALYLHSEYFSQNIFKKKCSKTSFEKNCFSAWASTLNMGLINKVDMVCLSPVGYGV